MSKYFKMGHDEYDAMQDSSCTSCALVEELLDIIGERGEFPCLHLEERKPCEDGVYVTCRECFCATVQEKVGLQCPRL